mmetsp:Transcript_14180/g.56524  ORF Transcript_14180/g.56524 Transcript_14180/m.56524 type:complete len:287 (-) Transcript_14180:474-1334(-)
MLLRRPSVVTLVVVLRMQRRLSMFFASKILLEQHCRVTKYPAFVVVDRARPSLERRSHQVVNSMIPHTTTGTTKRPDDSSAAAAAASGPFGRPGGASPRRRRRGDAGRAEVVADAREAVAVSGEREPRVENAGHDAVVGVGALDAVHALLPVVPRDAVEEASGQSVAEAAVGPEAREVRSVRAVLGDSEREPRVDALGPRPRAAAVVRDVVVGAGVRHEAAGRFGVLPLGLRAVDVRGARPRRVDAAGPASAPRVRRVRHHDVLRGWVHVVARDVVVARADAARKE